jgi:hypothetical protein
MFNIGNMLGGLFGGGGAAGLGGAGGVDPNQAFQQLQQANRESQVFEMMLAIEKNKHERVMSALRDAKDSTQRTS